MGDVSTMVMGPTRGTFVKPDSVLARTAHEMVAAHGGGAGPRDGMTICPQCGDPLPCAAGRAAAEVLAAAGLAQSSGLIQAVRQGLGPSSDSPPGQAFPQPRREEPVGHPALDQPEFGRLDLSVSDSAGPALGRPYLDRPYPDQPYGDQSGLDQPYGDQPYRDRTPVERTHPGPLEPGASDTGPITDQSDWAPAGSDRGHPDQGPQDDGSAGQDPGEAAARTDEPHLDPARPEHAPPSLGSLGPAERSFPTSTAAGGRPSDTAAPANRPPLEPPQPGQPNRPTQERPQPGQPNRPPLEPPQLGQQSRPLLQPPQLGQPNRPPLEPPQLGQQNRPLLQPPQLGQQNRPLMQPPQAGQQGRPLLQPPQAGQQPRPQAGESGPSASAGQPPAAGSAPVPTWSSNAIRHTDDTAPSGLPGLDTPSSPNGSTPSQDTDRRGGGHPNDPSAA